MGGLYVGVKTSLTRRKTLDSTTSLIA